MLTPDYLIGWIAPGQRTSNELLRQTLERLGHPERAVPAVLVGGTNGKGSTVAFLDAILRAAGYRVGTFTSPALADFHEQICYNGTPLTNTQGQALALLVRRAAPDRLTLFETAAAMAFLAFEQAHPDIALVEVGMGGRLDATNVCDPLLSILTSIALDHVRELGGDLGSIAREKAAIGRPGRPLVTGASGQARAWLEPDATNGAMPIDVLNEDFRMDGTGNDLVFVSPSLRLKGLRLGIPGTHQRDNAALAVQAASRLTRMTFRITASAIREGLEATRLRGRLEWFCHPEGYRFLVDGGHNPHAALALARNLRTTCRGSPRWLAVAIFEDKDVRGFLAPLLPEIDHLICTRSSANRCIEPDRLRQTAREVARKAIPTGAPVPEISIAPTVADTIEAFGRNKRGANILCGSLSIVHEAEQAIARPTESVM